MSLIDVYTHECWRWLINKLNQIVPLSWNWQEQLIGWAKDSTNKVYGKLWNITPTILTQEIRKERNRHILQDQELNSQAICMKIKVAITKVMNSDLRKRPKEEGSFIEWDAEIKKLWPHLINPPLSYKKKNNIAKK